LVEQVLLPMSVKPVWRDTANSWVGSGALRAVADARNNYGGAAENHRCHGDVQQETEGGEKHEQADGSHGKQVAACPAGWLGVLELAYPGGVLVLELALKVLQQVTVKVIQH
jgi:hypothetical protein